MSSIAVNLPSTRSPCRDTLIAPDGAPITVWCWPRESGRPTLHWAHGTGFHARLYTPLLDRLSRLANVSAWDMRGHGASHDAGHLDSYCGWETYYQDLEVLVDQAEEPIWLAGHSIGAMCCIALASRRPDKVQGLLIVDPVVMNRWQAMALPITKRLHKVPRSNHIANAARRRAAFDSRAAARDHYRGRGTFRTWSEDCLKLYVKHGFVDDHEHGVRLAATPAWESATFAGEHDPWPNIRRLGQWGRPVSLLAADTETTFPYANRGRFTRLASQTTLESVPGTTHSLPLERPDCVAAAAARLLGVENNRAPTVPTDRYASAAAPVVA